jgi:hypothetical protein
MQPVSFHRTPIHFGLTAEKKTKVQDELVEAGQSLTRNIMGRQTADHREAYAKGLQGVAQFLQVINQMETDEQ